MNLDVTCHPFSADAFHVFHMTVRSGSWEVTVEQLVNRYPNLDEFNIHMNAEDLLSSELMKMALSIIFCFNILRLQTITYDQALFVTFSVSS